MLNGSASETSGDGGGDSSGAIVGVVVALFLVCSGIAGAVVCHRRSGKGRDEGALPPLPPLHAGATVHTNPAFINPGAEAEYDVVERTAAEYSSLDTEQAELYKPLAVATPATYAEIDDDAATAPESPTVGFNDRADTNRHTHTRTLAAVVFSFCRRYTSWRKCGCVYACVCPWIQASVPLHHGDTLS